MKLETVFARIFFRVRFHRNFTKKFHVKRRSVARIDRKKTAVGCNIFEYVRTHSRVLYTVFEGISFLILQTCCCKRARGKL